MPEAIAAFFETSHVTLLVAPEEIPDDCGFFVPDIEVPELALDEASDDDLVAAATPTLLARVEKRPVPQRRLSAGDARVVVRRQPVTLPRVPRAVIAGLAIVSLGAGLAVLVPHPDIPGAVAGVVPVAVPPEGSPRTWIGSLRELVASALEAPPPELAEVNTEGGEMVEVAPGYGVIEITTSVDADLWIDGGPRGVVQGAGLFTLPVGEYEIALRVGGEVFQETVEVKDGRSVRLDYSAAQTG